MSERIFISYTGAVVARVVGKDAARYLQNRLSNDISKLLPGAGVCEAAALSPQGKIEVVFLVLAMSAQDFLLVTDGGDRVGVLASLKRFQVAERITVTDESDDWKVIHVSGIVDPNAGESRPWTFATVADGSFTLRVPRFAADGVHCLIKRPDEALFHTLTSGHAELTQEAATLFRINANVPVFPEELNDTLIVNDALRPELVSFTKGCYVGQEVVAKIDALGRSPRILMRFKSTAKAIDIRGASVSAAAVERPIGTVVTVVDDASRNASVGFVAIKNDEKLLSSRLTAHNFEINRWPAST